MELPFIVLNALLEGAEKTNVKNIDGRIWNLPIWIGSGQNIFAGVFCRNWFDFFAQHQVLLYLKMGNVNAVRPCDVEPTFDPNFGFKNGRKERGNVT